MPSLRKSHSVDRRLWKDWKLIALSLLIAVCVWLVHNLSKDYHAYMNFRIAVTTDIKGYAGNSLSNEILVMRGRATGFFILKNRLKGKNADIIPIEVLSSRFHKEDEFTFSLNTSDVRPEITGVLGGSPEIDFIETSRLTFRFIHQSFRKVPVVAHTTFSFREQYMQVGRISVSPDSVIIHGDSTVLCGINAVVTRQVVKENLSQSVQGVVMLETVDGVRCDRDRVSWAVTVDRYVEHAATVTPEIINLPPGKSLILIPSRIQVTYRVPFRTSERPEGEIPFTIDYDDFIASKSSRVVPRLAPYSVPVYSYSTEPRLVECILMEERI